METFLSIGSLNKEEAIGVSWTKRCTFRNFSCYRLRKVMLYWKKNKIKRERKKEGTRKNKNHVTVWNIRTRFAFNEVLFSLTVRSIISPCSLLYKCNDIFWTLPAKWTPIVPAIHIFRFLLSLFPPCCFSLLFRTRLLDRLYMHDAKPRSGSYKTIEVRVGNDSTI